MENLQIRYKNINYMVNYWTELLGVMFIICDNQEDIKMAGAEYGNARYRDEIIRNFLPFSNHPAISMLKKLSLEYFFIYDAPVTLFLMISENKISLKKLCKWRRPIEKPLFDNFLNAIKDFEKVSGFEKFYSSHSKFYSKCIHEFISDLNKFSPIVFLYKTLNTKSTKTLNINLMCGITSANYGIFVNNKLFANIRPYKFSRGHNLPCFSYEPIYFTTLILHEFAHPYINPLVEKSVKKYKPSSAKYTKYLKNFDYGDNMFVYISETIIRAIECLYVYSNFNDNYEDYVNTYIDEGFVMINQVVKILQNNSPTKSLKKLVDKIVKIF